MKYCSSETKHFGPYVVKAKMHLKGGCSFQSFSKIEKNTSPLKCILTVPTKGPKCFVSELHPFNFSNSSNGTPCSIFFLQQLHFYYHFSRGLMTDLRIGSPMMASPLSGSIPITIEEAVSLKSLLLGSSCKPFPNGWMGMKPAVLPAL